MTAAFTRRALLAAMLGFGAFGAVHRSNAGDAPSPDATARYLAGLLPAGGTPEAGFAADPAWRQHAVAFDQAWTRFDRDRLAKIRGFASQNLVKRQPTLLYMFSGPDYLYANAFFPDATTYVLSGLEPIGPIPHVTGRSGRSLASLRGSLNSVLNLSFFRTREMRQRLSGGEFAGTLPLLMIFLARAGKTVETVDLVRLDAAGAVVAAGGVAARGEVNGVKIVISDKPAEIDKPAAERPPAAEQTVVGIAAPETTEKAAAIGAQRRTLYYFQTDVSNAGPGLDALTAFCATLGPADGFVKSASYLMHEKAFSKIRDMLLERTELVLEDDSGIPVQYFDATKWDLMPFGRYLGPIGLFPGRGQRQLTELYARVPPKPLAFGIGYRYRENQSNLLLAMKKK